MSQKTANNSADQANLTSMGDIVSEYITSGGYVSGGNVSGAAAASLDDPLPISLGGTGATTRLAAFKQINSEGGGSANVSAPTHFLGLISSNGNWTAGGYVGIANAKTALGITASAISSTLGNTPVASATNATSLGGSAASEYVTLSGAQTITGAKTFTTSMTVKAGAKGIVTSNASSYVQICGGESNQHSQGATLSLCGAEYADNPGGFAIKAATSSGAYFLRGKTDGTLSWGGKYVMLTEHTLESFGAKGDGTTDDTTALLDAFSAGGKLVGTPGKTYLFASRTYVPYGNFELDLNGATVKNTAGNIMVFCPSEGSSAYNGPSNITIRNGTWLGGEMGFAHNKDVLLSNMKFLNSEEDHNIQVMAVENLHIEHCYFKGLKGSGKPEHINFDDASKGVYADNKRTIGFPFLFDSLEDTGATAAIRREAANHNSEVYDETPSANVSINHCTFVRGSGSYNHFDAAIGTHYNPHGILVAKNACISNCSISGYTDAGAIRPHGWENVLVRDCYIETNEFGFSFGNHNRGVKNVTFRDSIIVQDYAAAQCAPICCDTYGGSQMCITNIEYKEKSDGTKSSDLILYKPGATITWKAWSLDGNDFYTNDLHANDLYAKDLYLSRANPYLNFIETDVTKGAVEDGYQGIYFKDKNGAVLGDVIFQKNDTSGLYSQLRFDHRGNAATDSTHTLFFRQNTAGNWFFMPSNTGTVNLGGGSNKWNTVYAATGTIDTSDERKKASVAAIPDAVLDAWGEVNWQQFQMQDAITEKGENARLHTGLIAQRIDAAFRAHGLDASHYGLFCYDEWEAEEAHYDEDGNLIDPAREAGNEYSLRYTEALAMEAAYQRRRANRAEARLAAVEERMAMLESRLAALEGK